MEKLCKCPYCGKKFQLVCESCGYAETKTKILRLEELD